MLTAILILVIASVSVQSQSQFLPELQLGRTICQSFKQTLINPESYIKNLPTVPTRYEGAIKITNTALPTAPAPKMPVKPFVTELPNCPDLCFNDILTSPLGCLDPILNVYSAAPIIETPGSPPLTSIDVGAAPARSAVKSDAKSSYVVADSGLSSMDLEQKENEPERKLKLDTAAQQRYPNNLSTQTKKNQNQYIIPRKYSIFSPITQIPRPAGRYAKSTKKSPRLTKRQYLAEMFRQTAVKNLVDISNAMKRPVNIPM
ncbi:unnamed protein product, partial [Brenthis ino]